MKPEALATLAELSQARQNADAAKLAEIRIEEQKIRAQLAALDDRKRMTQRMPLMSTLPQRRLGGDMLWQAWVGRTRRDLQIKLARNLARQGAAQRALQKSFGKRSALEAIQADATFRTQKRMSMNRLDAMTSLSIQSRQK